MRLKARLSFILCLILFLTTKSFGQTVKLNYDNQTLNDILLDLNSRYSVQVSIDANLANQCVISINRNFRSIEDALQALAGRCDMNFIKVAEAYVFRSNPADPDPPEPKPQLRQYLYQGTIVEKGTGEPLPYSVLQWGGGGLVTDENGWFSFKSTSQEERGVFQYLGYQPADTVLAYGNQLVIALDPIFTELATVEVVSPIDMTPLTNIGGTAGHIKFTDINNNLVPGLSDNMIFNNLRLYPGIMAAGESIADFVIWGSYAGQNHVIYDGISLFNSWGVNDDMGRVNPYMIKNVEVFKGGYNVQHGDRVGGVVMMDTRSGNRNEVTGNLSLTNQLGNAYLNLPLFKNNATLQLAGRKTIFDAFDLSSNFGANADLIVPQYDYGDFNVKFTTHISPSDLFEFSYIYSEDEYQGNIRNPGRRNLAQDLNLSSVQTGTSLKYSRKWAGGGSTRFLFSQSDYEPELDVNYFRTNGQGNDQALAQFGWQNPIKEVRSGITHTFVARGSHLLKVSAEYVKLNTALKSSANERVLEDASEESKRLSFFVHDQIWWSDAFSMELGLKADAPSGASEVFWQPRINARWDISQKWNIHGAWGLYNQFVSKNFIRDELDNRTEVWQVADGNTANALDASHAVLGVNYKAEQFELGLEGFYKTSSGFRRIDFDRNGDTLLLEGESRTLGMELFARKKVAAHEFWLSYTLSEVEERYRFRNGQFSRYRQAPQSQKHEVKLAASFNFDPLSLSITNVYGSGFPNSQLIDNDDEFDPYWRTDVALQYQFDLPRIDLDVGLSILNLFNNENVRLNQTIRTPNGVRLNTVGIPFTPTVYVNVKF